MALEQAKPADIPSDAIRLTREEAVSHQLHLIYNWHNWKDVFFIKYAPGILAGASSIVGIYLNNYYRRKLKLGHYGSNSSYLASAIIPAGFSMVLHYSMVLPNVVLQDTCAVCTEIRAAGIQSIVGCVMPSILAPLAGFSNALNYGTYSIPYLNEPWKVINLWQKLTKPIGNLLFGIFLGQALLASGMTILETQAVNRLNNKLKLLYSAEEQD